MYVAGDDETETKEESGGLTPRIRDMVDTGLHVIKGEFFCCCFSLSFSGAIVRGDKPSSLAFFLFAAWVYSK